MPTVTLGATTLTPLLMLGADWERPSRNIIHNVIDLPEPVVSLKDAGLRTGTLEYLCETFADGLALEALHALPGTLLLADTDLPDVAMSYITTGTIRLQLDPETQTLAILTVGFQEVSA